jgi:hypothetical protein
MAANPESGRMRSANKDAADNLRSSAAMGSEIASVFQPAARAWCVYAAPRPAAGEADRTATRLDVSKRCFAATFRMMC